MTTDATPHLRSMLPVLIELDVDESGVWTARVPAHPGLDTDGDTPEQAFSNLVDATRVFFARGGRVKPNWNEWQDYAT